MEQKPKSTPFSVSCLDCGILSQQQKKLIRATNSKSHSYWDQLILPPCLSVTPLVQLYGINTLSFWGAEICPSVSLVQLSPACLCVCVPVISSFPGLPSQAKDTIPLTFLRQGILRAWTSLQVGDAGWPVRPMDPPVFNLLSAAITNRHHHTLFFKIWVLMMKLMFLCLLCKHYQLSHLPNPSCKFLCV